MAEVETKNAKITSTMLGKEDHGILSTMIMLDYGSSGQGFGGYALDQYDKSKKVRVGTAFGLEFIRRILDTLEVTSWEKLPGTFCRVRASWTKIEAIGHPLKDQWFVPEELVKEFV